MHTSEQEKTAHEYITVRNFVSIAKVCHNIGFTTISIHIRAFDLERKTVHSYFMAVLSIFKIIGPRYC